HRVLCGGACHPRLVAPSPVSPPRTPSCFVSSAFLCVLRLQVVLYYLVYRPRQLLRDALSDRAALDEGRAGDGFDRDIPAIAHDAAGVDSAGASSRDSPPGTRGEGPRRPPGDLASGGVSVPMVHWCIGAFVHSYRPSSARRSLTAAAVSRAAPREMHRRKNAR